MENIYKENLRMLVENLEIRMLVENLETSVELLNLLEPGKVKSSFDQF